MSNRNDNMFTNYSRDPQLGIPPVPFSTLNFNPGAIYPPGFFPPVPFLPGGIIPAGYNFPGGNLYPAGIPNSPPPNFTPKQNNPNVQYLNNNFNNKSSNNNTIRFCLFKFIYIWQRNGKQYWIFLTNIDRNSISGFRWLGNTWAYFGLALNKIDSFLCYNNFRIETDTRSSNSGHKKIKKEHCISGDKEIYSTPIKIVNLPEFKEDYSCEILQDDDTKNLLVETPYLKSRIINFYIILEVTYPLNYNDDIKASIKKAIATPCDEARLILSSSRNCDDDIPIIENIRSSSSLVPKALELFSTSFINNLKSSNIAEDIIESINYNMREETYIGPWSPYIY